LDTYPKTLKTARNKIRQVRKARVILKWAQGICRRIPRHFYLKHRWDIAAFRYFEDVLRAPDPANSPYLATLSTHMKEVIKTKTCYDSTLFVPFEYITMPIPCGYDTLLTTQYGDYMTPVHEDTFHGALLFDPDHSYKEYMKMPVSKRKQIG
jgi:lipopolysaccharide cholinephosphotransferase